MPTSNSNKLSAYSWLSLENAESTITLIIRFTGLSSELPSIFDSFDELLFGFAIVTLSFQNLPLLMEVPAITYIETPRFFSPQLFPSEQAACISSLKSQGLSGKGVLCCVIDTGIDYRNPQFIAPDGSSRIVAIYDDETRTFYTRGQINEVLLGSNDLPLLATSPHGTNVATIMAGNDGVAFESDLFICRLQNNADNFTTTASLMRCFTYAVKTADALRKPISINLSYGTNAGSHMGDGLLEQYLDALMGYGQCVITVGSGNSASNGQVAEGTLSAGTLSDSIRFSTGDQTGTFYLFAYTPAFESVDITLSQPSTNDKVEKAISGPTPYSTYIEHAFRIVQTGLGGIWTVQINAPLGHSLPISYQLYLSTSADFDARFFIPTQQGTFTIPSTAKKVLSVGAYNANLNAYAPFSGRGFVSYIETPSGPRYEAVKPEVVAPGVGIRLPSGQSITGTSYAAPFVSGTAALLMQWGIVNGNDPALYGQKVKSAIIKGTEALRAEPLRPNERTGFGALCAANSFL